MTTTDTLVLIAGSPTGQLGYVDGVANEARLHQPLDIRFDPAEEWLYFADYGNFAVRRVNVDTREVETFAVLDASPNCLVVDDNGLIWVNTIGPNNDAYEYDVETPGDAAAEFALGTKVPNQGSTEETANALWLFEPDGNLVFRVNVTSLVIEPGPFEEPGVTGSFVGQTTTYTPGATVSGVAGKQRNVQDGRPFGASAISNFVSRLGTFSVASDFDAGDGGDFDVDHGYWFDDGAGYGIYPTYTLVEDGWPPPDGCPGGEDCGDPCPAPDQSCCCVDAQARDGAFSSNTGMIDIGPWALSGRPLAYLFGLDQYPSNTGVAVVDYQTDAFPGRGADCIDDIDDCLPVNVPSGLVGYHGDSGGKTACVRWSDAFGSTNVDEYPRGFAEWGGGGTATRVGWQIARGAQPGMGDTWLSEIGNSMYQTPDGFLQTYLFTSAYNVGSPTHQGLHRAPVRGVAYSVTRDAWFFSTSASSGAYGPYTKNVSGTLSPLVDEIEDMPYHAIMQMVPFVEESISIEYELGGITATFNQEIEVTGAGTLDTAMGFGSNPGMAPLTEGTLEQPPDIEPFVPDVNPLPPDPEAPEVPLPPWVPGPGPFRRST